jgi:hypothetical protein
MLATAYLLAGPSTPERDILPIQVGGVGVGLPHLIQTQVYYTPGNGEAMSRKTGRGTIQEEELIKQGYLTPTLYFSQISDIQSSYEFTAPLL